MSGTENIAWIVPSKARPFKATSHRKHPSSLCNHGDFHAMMLPDTANDDSLLPKNCALATAEITMTARSSLVNQALDTPGMIAQKLQHPRSRGSLLVQRCSGGGEIAGGRRPANSWPATGTCSPPSATRQMLGKTPPLRAQTASFENCGIFTSPIRDQYLESRVERQARPEISPSDIHPGFQRRRTPL